MEQRGQTAKITYRKNVKERVSRDPKSLRFVGFIAKSLFSSCLVVNRVRGNVVHLTMKCIVRFNLLFKRLEWLLK